MRLAYYLTPFTALFSFSNPSTANMGFVTIHASGSHTIKRAPELVDLHLRIHHEAADATSALEAVRSASADVAAYIRQLAPPKAEVSATAIDSEELDIDDEKRDPAFPVTSWSMQQLRTWSVTPDDEGKPRPPRPVHRAAMMMATAPEEEKKPQKVYHAETSVRATFHDFAKLGETIDQITVSPLGLGGDDEHERGREGAGVQNGRGRREVGGPGLRMEVAEAV